jgi:acyl-CoA thioesterase-1
MKIVVIGGSIVNGFPVKDKESWISLWAASSNHEIINKGVNGNIAEHIINRFHNDVIAEKPDAAIIMFGTKDIATLGEDPEYVFSELQIMINKCIDHQIKPIVGIPLLIDVPAACKVMAGDACIDYVAANERMREYRQMILDASAEQGFEVIDLQGGFVKAIAGKDPADYYSDGLKLNAKGHKIVRSLITL